MTLIICLKCLKIKYKQISDYLATNSLSVFPYDYTKEYKINNISADKDPESGIIRIFYNDMTVFMRRKYTSLFRAKFDSNWCITHSDGYMLYYYDFYKEPFVRRGVLRISRNNP